MTRVRKAANLSIDGDLLEQARNLNINIFRAAEQGVLDAVRKEKEHIWKLENAEAFRYSNEFVEKHGIPLARHRKF